MKYIITVFTLLFFVEILFSLSNINSVGTASLITEFQLFEGQIWLLTVLVIFLIILYFITSFLSTKDGKSKIHLFKAYIAIVLGVFIVANILSLLIISDFKDIQIVAFDLNEKQKFLYIIYDVIRGYWQYLFLIAGSLFVFIGTTYLKNKEIK